MPISQVNQIDALIVAISIGQNHRSALLFECLLSQAFREIFEGDGAIVASGMPNFMTKGY